MKLDLRKRPFERDGTPRRAYAATLASGLLVLTILGCHTSGPGQTTQPSGQQTVRCTVVGGLVETGLWSELSSQFERTSGHRVEVVASGPKDQIVQPFVDGQADLIAMHACDTMINLAADGIGADPQPWAKNDFLIVGPRDDPAGIRGTSDAVAALRKIVETKSKLLVHSSLGVQEVLHDLLSAGRIELDPEATLLRVDDKSRQMALLAGKEQAYTIVGRIPFLNGKMPNRDLEIMVQGDPRLRRPYLVMAANPQRKAFVPAARQLADFLRSPAAQAVVAEFGRGKYDEQPLFFAIDGRAQSE